MTVASISPEAAVAAPRSPRLTLLFDADCGFCGRTAMLLHRLDRDQVLRIVPLQRAAERLPDAPSAERLLDVIHVRDEQGRWTIGGAAWLLIMDEVPALRPVGRLVRTKPVRPLVEPAYRWIADHRWLLSRLLGARACRLRPPTGQRPACTAQAGRRGGV